MTVLEATVEKGKITLTPKSVVDRHIVESLADYKAGRVYGPFDSVKEMMASMKPRKVKARSKK